jgi:hypothetical protein
MSSPFLASCDSAMCGSFATRGIPLAGSWRREPKRTDEARSQRRERDNLTCDWREPSGVLRRRRAGRTAASAGPGEYRRRLRSDETDQHRTTMRHSGQESMPGISEDHRDAFEAAVRSGAMMRSCGIDDTDGEVPSPGVVLLRLRPWHHERSLATVSDLSARQQNGPISRAVESIGAEGRLHRDHDAPCSQCSQANENRPNHRDAVREYQAASPVVAQS